MDDRELLELAAKAVGEDVTWHETGSYFYRKSCDWPAEKGFFNPLHDDGEALRLAVDLSFQVKTCETGVDVCDEAGDEVWCEFAEPNCCHYQMVRRAIVCAAAEIGKAMP